MKVRKNGGLVQREPAVVLLLLLLLFFFLCISGLSGYLYIF